MTVPITGGLGYIGSHAVLVFLESGYTVAVVDRQFAFRGNLEDCADRETDGNP